MTKGCPVETAGSRVRAISAPTMLSAQRSARAFSSPPRGADAVFDLIQSSRAPKRRISFCAYLLRDSGGVLIVLCTFTIHVVTC